MPIILVDARQYRQGSVNTLALPVTVTQQYSVIVRVSSEDGFDWSGVWNRHGYLELRELINNPPTPAYQATRGIREFYGIDSKHTGIVGCRNIRVWYPEQRWLPIFARYEVLVDVP